MKLNVDFKNLNFKQKIAACFVIAFILLCAAIPAFRYAANKYSNVTVSFDNSSIAGEKLRALNGEAVSGSIKKNCYAYFSFTPYEQKLLKEYYEHFGSVCISVRIGVKNVKGKKFIAATGKEQLFYYGFLNQNDFTEKGKLNAASKRILSGCDLRSFIQNSRGWTYFDNGFSIEKNLKEEQLPKGFVIYSAYPVRISDFFVTQAKVGYDCTGEIPFFGVSSNGGSFAGELGSVDFSGCSMVFPVENTRYSIMPKIEMSFVPCTDYGTPEDQLSVRINAGGDKLRIRRAKDVSETSIQTSTLLSPFTAFEITENAKLVSKLLMTTNSSELLPVEANKVVVPLKTDPGLILSSRKNYWRTNDYEIYEWDRFPGTLFFDTADYKVQADFFRRLAFFAEKTGFRGRILTDEELGDMHGYNAHDYSAQSLAAFFTKAEKSGVTLTEKELILKDILIRNQLIIPDNYEYKAGNGAVISVSRESKNYLRQSFIAHEAWHGIFFTNEEFRNAVAAVYYTVDNKTMSFMKNYWLSQPGLGYDPSDEFLMHNEFMAYIMQQPLNGESGVASYFVHCAERGSVMEFIPELSAWVRQTKGITFEDAARVFDSFAFDNWGLACGRVALITR